MFLKILLFSILIIINGLASSSKNTMPIIVSVKWLKQHINDKDILLIDVRKEQEYKKGHIKGAVNMPVMKDFFTKKNTKSTKTLLFERAL